MPTSQVNGRFSEIYRKLDLIFGAEEGQLCLSKDSEAIGARDNSEESDLDVRAFRNAKPRIKARERAFPEGTNEPSWLMALRAGLARTLLVTISVNSSVNLSGSGCLRVAAL